jgi:hypothetical protein
VGNFSSFSAGNIGGASGLLSLNDAGQIAMHATTTGDVSFPTMAGAGYWVVDADGNLNPVVLIGQELEGSRVTDVEMVDGNGIVVTLDTGLGATYQLRRRDTLNAGDWQNEGAAADATGNSIDLRHPNALGTDKQFYDVLITLPDS